MIFPYPSTSPGHPLIISLIFINNTHPHSPNHQSQSHVTVTSHSLTSWPTSSWHHSWLTFLINDIIQDPDLTHIQLHYQFGSNLQITPYLLSRSLSDLTHINSGDSHSTWKHINTPFLHFNPISPFLTFRVAPFFLFSSSYIFPCRFILRCTLFHFYSNLHILSSLPLHLSLYSFIAYISPSAPIQFYQSSFSRLGLTLFLVP
jgi:hypothetical protein